MAARTQVHRGFIYSREKLRWGRGDFAIVATEGKDGYLWVAEWDGAPIAQGKSLHKAILRLEDEGYIPVLDQEDEISGEKDTGGGRYVDAIPAKCSRCCDRENNKDLLRVIAGYVTPPTSGLKKGGKGTRGWHITGKCTHCGVGIHVTIAAHIVPQIPESVKKAAWVYAVTLPDAPDAPDAPGFGAQSSGVSGVIFERQT